MISCATAVVSALLFIAVVPGGFVRIAPRMSLPEQALLHGVVFVALSYLLYTYILPQLEQFENPDTRERQPCPEGYTMCPSGECRLATDLHSPCA
jgi:hypothetical protein